MITSQAKLREGQAWWKGMLGCMLLWRMKRLMLKELDKKEGDLNKPPLDQIQPVSDIREKSLMLLTSKLRFRTSPGQAS